MESTADSQKPGDLSSPSEKCGTGGHKNGQRCGRMGKRRFLFPLKVLVILAVKSAVVMLIWNNLVPEAFHGPVLDYLQAVELTVLAKLLVGFGGGGPGWRHRGMHGHHWRHLSPEQKEELKKRFNKP